MTTGQRRARRVNPFEVLGLTSMASPAEVTAAYRSLAKKFHPDLYEGRPERVRKAAERRMQELNEAYKVARAKLKAGDDGYGYGDGGGGRTSPWSGAETGAWSRTAKRTETEAARRARLAASRVQAERAAREHESQARMFQRLRVEARKAAKYGDAVARPKGKLPSTLYGAGQACHTNEVPCRDCKVIQRLPANWQERMVDTAFFCSNCGGLLLSR